MDDRRIRVVIGVVALSAAAAGCSGSGTTEIVSTDPAPSVTAERADDESIELPEVQAMMTRYLAALRTGDVDAAMSERCKGSRVPAEDVELFAAQASRLIESEQITGVDVTGRSQLEVAPADPADDAFTFDYVLLLDGVASEPLTGVAIRQDEAVRLCGHVQSRIPAIFEQLRAPLPSGPRRDGPLSVWVPSVGPEGATSLDDGEVRERAPDLPGWEVGWTAAWQFPTYGGARVTIDDFTTEDAAAEAVSASLREVTSDATEVFAVDGAPYAIGVRYSAVAWTMIQPADVGLQCDRALMRFADVVVSIDSCGLPPGSSHQQTLELAAQVVEAAGS